MLLHTKLINIFTTKHEKVKIELLVSDLVSMGSTESRVLYDGESNPNNSVAMIESEFQMLELKGQEPEIIVHDHNKKYVLYHPKEKVVRTEKATINIYF